MYIANHEVCFIAKPAYHEWQVDGEGNVHDDMGHVDMPPDVHRENVGGHLQ
jgi:hypothetical protein